MSNDLRPLRFVSALAVLMLVALYGPRLIAQATVGTPTAPVGATEITEWGSAFIWAFLSSQALKFWRSHPKLGGFTEQTAKWIQRSIAGVVAFAGGLGISFVFDGDKGTLITNGLTLASIWAHLWPAVWHWVRQFTLQEYIYGGPVREA